jgi:tetratricopeptide (TPR) repeat protein
VYPCLFIGALLVIVYTNLNGARADSLSKYGAFYESQRRWDAAAAVHEGAHRLQPGQARYAGSLARVLMETARGDDLDRPAERDRRLARAVALLERALQISPLDPDHSRNLAATHRRWAASSGNATERRRHTEQADGYYQRAVTLSPNNVALRNEWAALHLERRDPARALAILDQSLRIDARYASTHLMRAKAHLAGGALEEALADYERALAIDPALLPAQRGKALVRERLEGQVP